MRLIKTKEEVKVLTRRSTLLHLVPLSLVETRRLACRHEWGDVIRYKSLMMLLLLCLLLSFFEISYSNPHLQKNDSSRILQKKYEDITIQIGKHYSSISGEFIFDYSRNNSGVDDSEFVVKIPILKDKNQTINDFAQSIKISASCGDLTLNGAYLIENNELAEVVGDVAKDTTVYNVEYYSIRNCEQEDIFKINYQQENVIDNETIRFIYIPIVEENVSSNLTINITKPTQGKLVIKNAGEHFVESNDNIKITPQNHEMIVAEYQAN
ncbi:hypothetical protein [Desulfosediminicola flagellatus]|uniref:hypothetical protein n=1 Tax=Desulfosediminicola flagellatus TaxID=2569541 RepID=UPI0010ABC8BE|nr:hypothetical protein [Desulfosediminicola flagellatus]